MDVTEEIENKGSIWALEQKIDQRMDVGGLVSHLLYCCISYWRRQQLNHGHTATFANIYHPPQPVTTGAVDPLAGGGLGSVDMLGPAAAASVYQQQQPQPTQINWHNNY
ncbi:unnamed protein product [Lactuca saligna]|uniref:Uncharacterized protein n=1 Tax=Lactuca saligna TaxID=75948 RepID=A0AA35VBP7_LACSI|nr:unnamed protein product [Lactuca saligna]